MSDETGPPYRPGEQPPAPQPAAAPAIYHYRIFLLGGTFFDVSSPNEPEKFFRYAKEGGSIWAVTVGVPWHAISAIAPIQMPGAGMTVGIGSAGGGSVVQGPWGQPPGAA